jgi:hypothetical protein
MESVTAEMARTKRTAPLQPLASPMNSSATTKDVFKRCGSVMETMTVEMALTRGVVELAVLVRCAGLRSSSATPETNAFQLPSNAMGKTTVLMAQMRLDV